MSSFRDLAAGLELFRAPIDRSLAAELVACLKTLQSLTKVTSAQLQSCGLAQALHQRLGLSVNLKTDPNKILTRYSAYVFIPTLNKNNPILHDLTRFFIENTDFRKKLDKSKTVLSGSIDLKTGRVSGVFSAIQSEIFLGSRLLDKNYFSAEEAVAILLHEVGHLVAYYAALTSMVRTNFVLQAVHTSTFQEAPVTAKIRMMKEIDQTLGIELKDKEVLAKGKEDIVVTMVIKEEAMKTRSELGYDFYDERCYEAMADQFSTFMGMGTALATALVKLNRYSGANTLGASVFGSIMNILLVALTFGAQIIVDILLGSLLNTVYDTTPERIARIKERMIRDLKDYHLAEDHRAMLVQEIEQLEDIDPNHYRELNIGLFIWNHVLPWGRSNINAAQHQQQLERLAHSDLYLKSAQLRGPSF